MDKDGIIFLAVGIAIIFFMGTYLSIIFITAFPAEDNVLIDGDDVVFYNIINADEIEIIMEDDVVYNIKLRNDNEIVDFTVNSDIHIELERHDTRIFWWDLIINPEPVYPDEYGIGRIIKVPDVGGD